jgi:murein DD-endopeptidase MepM/ murein hydrolase activator NlpD
MRKILKPYLGANPKHIVQPFGVKQNKVAAELSGLDFHTGIDLSFPHCYGTFLVAPEDCIVANIVAPNRLVDEKEGKELLLKGYGIRMQSIVEPDLFYVYWHTLPVFPVNVGDKVKRGQIVAQIGNSGIVISSNGFVPVELRTRPPYDGSHLHYEIYRWVNNKKEYIDPSSMIDWNSPVELDWISATKQILFKISNILKNR